MRRLFLLRHAKSSWPSNGQTDGQDDFGRPLNDRGRRAVPLIATFMQREGLHADLILCSTACRARETLALLLPSFPGEATVQFEDSLYLASAAKLFNRLKQIDNRFDQVLVVAHNPGLQDLAIMLAAKDADDDLAQITGKFPTGALAQIDFPTKSWTSLERHSGTLTRFITPRALAAEASR